MFETLTCTCGGAYLGAIATDCNRLQKTATDCNRLQLLDATGILRPGILRAIESY